MSRSIYIKASTHSGRHIILTAISATAANVFFFFSFYFLVLIDWCVTFSRVPQGTPRHGAPPLKARNRCEDLMQSGTIISEL